MRIDCIEFAGLDQGGDDAPVCSASIVTGKERVFAVQGDGADGPLDGIGVHLDAAIGEEHAKAIPVFGDVLERFAQGCFG